MGEPDAPDEGSSDRRTETRAPIELRVDYKRLNSFFSDYTRNISKGGTFIVTARPLPVGTEFVFQLGVPGLEKPLELHGQVTWIVNPEDPMPEGKQAGMGIRFEYRSHEERAQVEGVVEALMVKSLGPAISKQLLDSSKST